MPADIYRSPAWLLTAILALHAAGCDDAPSSTPDARDTEPRDASPPADASPDARTPDDTAPLDISDPPADARTDSQRPQSDSSPDTSRGVSTLPECEDGLNVLFSKDGIDPPARDSNAYRAPSSASVRAVRQSIADIAAGDAGRAQQNAELGGYRLCRLPSQAGPTVVWQPDAPSRGRARWAVRPSAPSSPLVVEAPHPVYDLDTLAESLAIFERARARALLAAGTHRCANPDATSCSGKTGACSDAKQRYRTSDMAHNSDTMFQAAHEAITRAFPRTTAASIHGFTLEGISLSDGTRNPTTADAPSARLGSALGRKLPAVRVTHCNDFPGADHRQRYCGTTNVQGRHLNGSPDACTRRATSASGRFIHLEQTRSIRKNFDPVVEAFAEVFSARRD